ncbi:uncharacterized protein LOC144371695 [Ictidomys tridecemlineatus]
MRRQTGEHNTFHDAEDIPYMVLRIKPRASHMLGLGDQSQGLAHTGEPLPQSYTHQFLKVIFGCPALSAVLNGEESVTQKEPVRAPTWSSEERKSSDFTESRKARLACSPSG